VVPWRVREYRPHRQRDFEWAVDLFALRVMFELREERDRRDRAAGGRKSLILVYGICATV
jgi:hypothetical protein